MCGTGWAVNAYPDSRSTCAANLCFRSPLPRAFLSMVRLVFIMFKQRYLCQIHNTTGSAHPLDSTKVGSQLRHLNLYEGKLGTPNESVGESGMKRKFGAELGVRVCMCPTCCVFDKTVHRSFSEAAESSEESDEQTGGIFFRELLGNTHILLSLLCSSFVSSFVLNANFS